jgi:cell division protein FtsN
MLVLEDVIPVPPVHELSPWDEGLDPQMQDGESESDMLLSDEDDDEATLVSPSAAALALERKRLAGTDVFVAAKASEPDYEGYRAWVRIAPLLLLLGALAFFSLYYLGNRMGEGGGQDTAQNAATNPAPAPETQAAAPAAAKPQIAESAPAPQSAKPSESSVVGASAETQKPAEQSKVETAKTEAPPAVIATAPAAPAASTAPAPVVTAAAPPTSSSPATTTRAVGNFTVQVGSYNDAAQAEERAGRLRSSGIEARVIRAEIPRRGIWYRVQAGRFASQEEASRYANEIKGKGATDNFIITAAQ